MLILWNTSRRVTCKSGIEKELLEWWNLFLSVYIHKDTVTIFNKWGIPSKSTGES